MENVILTVHLILAALLIGVVLLQRSEGGGLGMGGGSGVMTGRQAANALSRATWILAAAFLVTSLALFIVAGRNAGSGSVLDRIGVPAAPAAPAGNLPALPAYVPPPAAGQPLTPPVPGGATQPAPSVPAATPAATATPPAAVPAPASAPAAPVQQPAAD